MARFVALDQFQISNIDLSFYSAYYFDDNLQKSANLTVNGTAYTDYYWVNGYDGFNDLQLEFLGFGFTQNIQGEFTGGTVNLVAEFDLDAPQSPMWFAEGISLSAVAIYNAAFTATTADELGLIEQAFSGNDIIDLSPFPDAMSGFAGNDLVRGGGGDDILEGGPGFDTAVYDQSIENYAIEFQGGTLVISSSLEGTDQLSGFEAIDFGGKIRTTASLNDLTPPTITSSTPSDGATGVEGASNIELSFSETIVLASGQIEIREGAENGPIVEAFDVQSSARVSAIGTTLTIDPSANLEGGKIYLIVIPGGAVEDAAGNSIGGTSIDFTTFAPNQAPTAEHANIIATEDGPVILGQLQATDPDGDALTFSPILTGQFAPGVSGLIIKPDGSYTFDPSDPSYQSLSQGEVGEFLGGYSVSDGTDTDDATITIAVTGANDTPQFNPSVLELATIASTPEGFSVNASDIDGDTLTYSSNDPAHGTVTGGNGGQFTYSPDPGFIGVDSITVTVSDGKGGMDSLRLVVTVNPTPSDDWAMLATSGFTGTIGGAGKVFGTSGFQDITVLDVAGTVSFDPSFNRGGDIVRFAGNGSDWQIIRSGSSATFTDGDTFVEVPVGPNGMSVVFDDGVRTLRFEIGEGSLKIGAQGFGNELVQITAPDDGAILPTGVAPDAVAQLLLASAAEVTAGGNLDIFGASGNETVKLLSGQVALDPSFNRGGDTLILDAPAGDFMANRIGSSVVLSGSDTEVLSPVGTTGMTLAFAGGDERLLLVDTNIGQILIGVQQIGFDSVALATIA